MATLKLDGCSLSMIMVEQTNLWSKVVGHMGARAKVSQVGIWFLGRRLHELLFHGQCRGFNRLDKKMISKDE